MRPVLLDTDIGSDVDDALALGVILASPGALDLVGVTTVGRGGAVRARVAAGLLGLAGRGDVDVCIGETRPLLRDENRFGWFDHEEHCVVPATPSKISDEPAPERIVRAARETDRLEIVLIGERDGEVVERGRHRSWIADLAPEGQELFVDFLWSLGLALLFEDQRKVVHGVHDPVPIPGSFIDAPRVFDGGPGLLELAQVLERPTFIEARPSHQQARSLPLPLGDRLSRRVPKADEVRHG